MGLDGILTFLGGLFGGGGAISGSDAAAAFTALQTQVCGIGQALAYSDSFVGSFLSGIHRFLSKIWQWFFNHILLKIVYWEGVAERFLKAWIGPIYHIIRDIVALVQYYYKVIFGPLLRLISILRKFLAILKLFHVGWATRLDRDLANIQQRITEAFQKVLRELNTIASYIALMLNPDGLLNSNILLGSLARDCKDLFAIQWGWNQQPISGDAFQAQSNLNPSITRDGAQSDATDAMEGNIPDYYQQTIAQVQSACSNLGYTVS